MKTLSDRVAPLRLLHQAPGFICYLRGPNFVFELANAAYEQIVGHRNILGKTVRAALPEIAGQGFFELLEHVFATGEPFLGKAMPIFLQREPNASPSEAFLDFIYQPIRGDDGEIEGILVQGHDLTEAVRAEQRRTEAHLGSIAGRLAGVVRRP